MVALCLLFACCSERDGMVHFLEEEETYHTGGWVGAWQGSWLGCGCTGACWLLRCPLGCPRTYPARLCLPLAGLPSHPCRRDDWQAGRPDRPLH